MSDFWTINVTCTLNLQLNILYRQRVNKFAHFYFAFAFFINLFNPVNVLVLPCVCLRLGHWQFTMMIAAGSLQYRCKKRNKENNPYGFTLYTTKAGPVSYV